MNLFLKTNKNCPWDQKKAGGGEILPDKGSMCKDRIMKEYRRFLERQEFGLASKIEVGRPKTGGVCRAHTTENFI